MSASDHPTDPAPPLDDEDRDLIANASEAVKDSVLGRLQVRILTRLVETGQTQSHIIATLARLERKFDDHAAEESGELRDLKDRIRSLEERHPTNGAADA